jgi:organic hydroperoxide reductase OsmC/OhrA
MAGKHVYTTMLKWTGNLGTGTSGYRDYLRDHVIEAAGKPALAGSADPHFRGDAGRWNPEELLVASLSACHQLSYLHLCADAGIVVDSYEDQADGTLVLGADGGGQFERVVLRPQVGLAAGADADLAVALHVKAHGLCFIARSMGFPVEVEPVVTVDGGA